MDKLIGKKINVEVTQSDIDVGCVNDTNNCPIAHAFNRKMSDVFGYIYEDGVAVGSNRIIFKVDSKPKETFFIFHSDDDISEWITRFDSKQHVDPIDIEVEVSSQTKGEKRVSHNNNIINIPIESMIGNANIVR